MTMLQLTSHYLGIQVNIKIEAGRAARLLNTADPMDEINRDIERLHFGYEPIYLTASQGRRIKNFFSSENKDYFDEVKNINNTQL